MTRFGYTLMTEQSGPKELVRYAVSAEQAGFDFEVSSDHYFPWLSSQGHAPYAWSVLGAVAHATEQVELLTYVTCPTIRYHPAVVAQKAATLQILADGRFTLGVGSGENLNEHAEARVIDEYLPAPLSEAEVADVVDTAIAEVTEENGEAPGMKQMGQVMKAATAIAAGKADGARLSAAVKARL